VAGGVSRPHLDALARMMIDETHDPALKSWVTSANLPGCDFPIQNLPLGVFRRRPEARTRVGVAIGTEILEIHEWLDGENLNGYLALSAVQRRELRRIVSKILAEGSPHRQLIPQADCQMLLPAHIGDYTDFYASLDHATNVGRLFRPDQPLLPNYKHLPIAYHGRASSIVVSGSVVRRPNGQLAEGRFGPTNELDYEIELGFLVGPGNCMGEPIPVGHADEHVGGVCLVNDWSARDIQRWEYQPLGPFLGKSFATSLSPWMVTIEALAPFRTPVPRHETAVLPYLHSDSAFGLDVTLEVYLRIPGTPQPVLLSRSSSTNLYWTFVQMVAHHTSNGCLLRPGDLIATGTVSGPEKMNQGCLLELTSNGREPIQLPSGEKRSFLQDGDEVIITGYCRREGYVGIGLGECTGRVSSSNG
jgi:fumarylacetoacetase